MMAERYNPEKSPKGMDLEECMDRATRFIGRNGMCLFLMDIVDSRLYPDQTKLFRDFDQLLIDLDAEFREYLPQNNLAVRARADQGFNVFWGDGAGGGINDASAIPRIMEFASENYPEIKLRYAVAEDGYDREGVKLIK
jgi:hypothetical protein